MVFWYFLLLMRLGIDSISCFWKSLISIFDPMGDLGPKWAPQIWHFGHQIWIIGRYHEIMYPFEGWYQLRNLLVEHHFPFEPGYVTNYFAIEPFQILSPVLRSISHENTIKISLRSKKCNIAKFCKVDAWSQALLFMGETNFRANPNDRRFLTFIKSDDISSMAIDRLKCSKMFGMYKKM